MGKEERGALSFSADAVTQLAPWQAQGAPVTQRRGSTTPSTSRQRSVLRTAPTGHVIGKARLRDAAQAQGPPGICGVWALPLLFPHFLSPYWVPALRAWHTLCLAQPLCPSLAYLAAAGTGQSDTQGQ